MKIIRDYWHSVPAKRQKIELLAVALVLIVLFENCSHQQVSKDGMTLDSAASTQNDQNQTQ